MEKQRREASYPTNSVTRKSLPGCFSPSPIPWSVWDGIPSIPEAPVVPFPTSQFPLGRAAPPLSESGRFGALLGSQGGWDQLPTSCRSSWDIPKIQSQDQLDAPLKTAWSGEIPVLPCCSSLLAANKVFSQPHFSFLLSTVVFFFPALCLPSLYLILFFP